MSKHIKLRKGYNIKLAGIAKKEIGDIPQPKTFSLKPSSFHGIERPKVLVQEGDTVKAGTPILIDKKHERIIHVAPVSGEVVEIRRGEKRKLLEIVILADENIEYQEFNKYSISDIKGLSREDIISELLQSGNWPSIIQRPYGLIADPDETPKSIFISGFDSHPLAPDFDYLLQGQDQNFQAGIDIAAKLTSGSVHLNINGKGEVSKIFSQPLDLQLNKISGPHPAGNVGVHIHHLDPINKGELVWTIDPVSIAQIGKLFLEGIHDSSKRVAVTGPCVKEPKYYQTYRGASVSAFLANNITHEHHRVISGNVLTGERIDDNGHMRHFDNVVTVIEEGDRHEPFGWVLPQFNKPSFHRALGLMAFMSPNKEFNVNTNTNGEPRAFVQTGEFEKVLPMDILPTYLIKAILAEDYDEIEALGIYEVIEEDLAICEFIDVSKHDIQAILREGLELLQHS